MRLVSINFNILALVLVYSCEEKTTLENIKDVWYPEFCSVNQDKNVNVVLLGTDLQSNKNHNNTKYVTKEMAESVAREVRAVANVRCNPEKPEIGDGLLKSWRHVVKAALDYTQPEAKKNKQRSFFKFSIKGRKGKKLKLTKHSIDNIEPSREKKVYRVASYNDKEIEAFYNKFIECMKKGEQYDEETYFLCIEVDTLFWRDEIGMKYPMYAHKVLDLGKSRDEIEIRIGQERTLVLYILERKMPIDLL